MSGASGFVLTRLWQPVAESYPSSEFPSWIPLIPVRDYRAIRAAREAGSVLTAQRKEGDRYVLLAKLAEGCSHIDGARPRQTGVHTGWRHELGIDGSHGA